MLIKHCKHSRLNAAAGPPGETHNRRRRSCTGVDCVPSVCKSHNGKKAKIWGYFIYFFCPAHSFPIGVGWKHPSTANAASSSVQLHRPKGRGCAHTLAGCLWTDPFGKLLMLYWAPHQKLIPCLLRHVGTAKIPPRPLSYCLTERDSLLINCYGLDCPKGPTTGEP